MVQNILPELNDREKFLMFHRELFPLKYVINDKLFALFNSLGIAFKDNLNAIELADAQRVGFKIYKGENYFHYPYVIMDYPKMQSIKNTFCVRCMFWYGHYFSISLLLTDKLAVQYADKILDLSKTENRWFFATAHNPWTFDLESGLFTDLQLMVKETILKHIEKHNYIKLVQKIEGENLEEVFQKYLTCVREINDAISGSSNTF